MIMEVESLGKPGWMRAWVWIVGNSLFLSGEQRGRDREDKHFENETNSTYL